MASLGSVLDSMGSIMNKELAAGIVSIADSTSSIMDNMNSAIENTVGVNENSSVNLVEIESRLDEIISTMSRYIESSDDSDESKDIYAVTGCIPEVWGSVYDSHFGKIEEQLEQIIENTKSGWLEHLAIGLSIIGASPTLGDGMDKGVKSILEWVKDNKKVLPFIGAIFANTTDVHADESENVTGTQLPGKVSVDEPANALVGDVEDVTGFSIMEKVKGVGSWFKDTGSAFIEDYKSRLHEQRSLTLENSSDVVGEGGIGNFFSSLVEEIKTTASLLLDLSNDLLNSENPFGLESVKIIGEMLITAGALWAMINTILTGIALIVVAVYTGIAEIVGSISAAGSALIASILEIASFIAGIIATFIGNFASTNSMESFTPARASSNDTIPGTYNDDSEYVMEYTRTIEAPKYLSALATNDKNVYSDSVDDKNAYTSNTDTARSDYAELLASNSKGNVTYSPIFNNNFDVQVTEEADYKKLWLDFVARMENDTASIMSSSGVKRNMI